MWLAKNGNFIYTWIPSYTQITNMHVCMYLIKSSSRCGTRYSRGTNTCSQAVMAGKWLMDQHKWISDDNKASSLTSTITHHFIARVSACTVLTIEQWHPVEIIKEMVGQRPYYHLIWLHRLYILLQYKCRWMFSQNDLKLSNAELLQSPLMTS